MRLRLSLRALAAALALGAAVPAAALNYSGYVGLQFSRDDVWQPAFQQQSNPHLDLNLGLTLDGYLYRPGVLDYSLGADYRRSSESPTGAPTTISNMLQYRGRVTAFGDPRTPLSVSVHALRSTEQSGANSTNPTSLDLDSRAYGVDVRYSEVDRPQVNASYTRTESINHIIGLPDATRFADIAGASLSSGSSGYTYTASYLGTWNSGTYAADNYDNHRISLVAKAGVAEKTELSVADTYYLRIPIVDSPLNPRQELNSLNAVVTRRPNPSGDFDQIAYGSTRGQQHAEGTPDLDRQQQALSYTHQHTFSNPEYRLRASVDASLAQNRVDTTETRDAAQSVSGTLVWGRELPDAGYFELRGGPSVGVVEPDGKGVDWGYGAALGGSYRRLHALTTYEATYDISWATDIGDLGTALRQVGQGSAVTPIGTGAMRGQLTLQALRRDSPRVGAAAYRSATLGGSYTWHRLGVSADLGIASGVSNPVTNAGIADGLFLALPYDSHTYSGSLSASAGVTERLYLGALGRFVVVDLPDRPTTTEEEVRGSLRYVIGALSMQLEERYVITETPAGTIRRNMVFLTVYRAFGSRY
jgi:hypothetical protein